MITPENFQYKPNAITEAFETIVEAREYMRVDALSRHARQDTPPGISTLETYAKKTRQYDDFLVLNDEEPWPVKTFLSRFAPAESTFYVMRAALKQRACERVEGLLKLQDQQQRQNKASGEWLYSVSKLRATLRQLEEIDSATHRICLRHSGVAKRKSTSKRDDLKLLSENWRDVVLQETTKSKIYEFPAIVLRYTGCRPFELKTGITVSLFGNRVRFEIDGAKCRETAGQLWRSMDFETTNLPDSLLHKLKHQERFVVTANEDSMRTYLAEVSKDLGDKVWISEAAHKKGRILSAYTMRHAFASDLREAGWTEEEVAAALGESVAETAGHYGTGRLRSSRSKALKTTPVKGSVETSRPVRLINHENLNGLIKQRLDGKKTLGGLSPTR